MKRWQIFLVGMSGLVVILLFPVYESKIAALAAISIVAAVVAGFVLHPKRTVFHVRTTTPVARAQQRFLEKGFLAVKIELARLWLLFPATILAVAFLVVSAAKGTLWKFSLIGHLDNEISLFRQIVTITLRFWAVLVFGALGIWVKERWALRDVVACSANRAQIEEGMLSYTFLDEKGTYYSGEGFPFAGKISRELARIVFYNADNPEVNKIAQALVFHKVVVIGAGLTDFDNETVKGARMLAESH